MAQVKDLRTQNPELQRSQQELSQEVASSAGISQSYGDRMTQTLSTLAKSDTAVQGYQRDSMAMEASVSDHLKISNSNTAECFSAVETLATRYGAVASRIDAWDHWYSTPAEPVTVVMPPPLAPPPVSDPEPAAPTAPMGVPSGPSVGGCVLSFSVHPSRDCIYHPNACPDSGWPLRWSCPRHWHLHPFLILSRRRLRRPWACHPVHSLVGVSCLSPSTHPAIASTIRTLVRIRGGREGGRSTRKKPTTKNLLRGGEPQKSRRNLLSQSGGRRLRGKNTPRTLRPRRPMQRRTPLRWGTSIASRKLFSLPPGDLHTGPLIPRTCVQFLQ